MQYRSDFNDAERLYFSIAETRRLYGKDNPGFPSEFLKAIGKDKINETGVSVKKTIPSYSYSKPVTRETKKIEREDGFRVGTKIRHKIFGEGMVVKVDGDKITVAFKQEFGIKVLMSDHPSITRLQEVKL